MLRLQGTKIVVIGKRQAGTVAGGNRSSRFAERWKPCEGLTADAPHLQNELADSESWQAYKRGAVNNFPFIWEFDLVSCDLFAALP